MDESDFYADRRKDADRYEDTGEERDFACMAGGIVLYSKHHENKVGSPVQSQQRDGAGEICGTQ